METNEIDIRDTQVKVSYVSCYFLSELPGLESVDSCE